MKLSDIKNTITSLNTKIEQKKMLSSRYAMVRFFLLILGSICIYYGYYKTAFFYYLLIGAILLFLWFAKLHRSTKIEIEVLEATMESYQDIVKRKSDEWKTFSDQGTEFLTDKNTQAFDLDIYGTASLYQYLNCAKTVLGRECFANLLSCHKQEGQAIIKRQKAVKELGDKVDFNITLTALLKLFQQHGRKKKKSTMEDFFTYMEQGAKTYPSFLRFIVLLVPIMTLTSAIYAFAFHGNIAYMGILGIASMSVAMLMVIKNAKSFHDVNIIEHTLSDYGNMFQHIVNEDFKSDILKDATGCLNNASKALRNLNRIVTMIRMRNDGIAFMVLNFFFLLDFQCVFALESWRKAYGSQVRTWFESLAMFEAMLSLSQLLYAKDTVCYPTVETQNKPSLATKALRHPLICETKSVANNFAAKQETYIITGSNMSGKTTFLRTIGLNLVLFHAGCVICGESFHASSMNLFTSMRIKDDVSEGISTFYAEILRIKEMIEESEQKEDMIVLIDEIFKGTNSADRIICAKEVLKQLHIPHVITMVSTHDFELCDLYFTKQSFAINYHFSEYYEEEAIRFDYTLKEGKCSTTNAQELLKMAGIKIHRD